MRKALLVLSSVVALMVASMATVLAAKPQEVIQCSNGYPSGEHFKLNIHGKKADYACVPSPGGIHPQRCSPVWMNAPLGC